MKTAKLQKIKMIGGSFVDGQEGKPGTSPAWILISDWQRNKKEL